MIGSNSPPLVSGIFCDQRERAYAFRGGRVDLSRRFRDEDLPCRFRRGEIDFLPEYARDQLVVRRTQSLRYCEAAREERGNVHVSIFEIREIDGDLDSRGHCGRYGVAEARRDGAEETGRTAEKSWGQKEHKLVQSRNPIESIGGILSLVISSPNSKRSYDARCGNVNAIGQRNYQQNGNRVKHYNKSSP